MDRTDDDELLRPRQHPMARFVGWNERYVVVRFALLRLLGLVYLVAFLVTALQFRPLIGHDGLLPATIFLDRVEHTLGLGTAVTRLPTLFWLGCSDHAIAAVAWVGVALSAAVLAGATNAGVMFVLWLLYFSVTQIGQTFYGYGWESQLCETGFLAIFLCPLRTLRPFRIPAPPAIVIVLFRWLVFRIMLGAGLIKLRGDPCWRELTCLAYHWETQPIPNPLSPYFAAMPLWFEKACVLVNHLVEVVAPWFAFGPRRARLVAGCLFVAFQTILILSGNLSFLNWLTIVPAIACFDDRALSRVVPRRFRALFDAAPEPSRPQRVAAWAYAAVVFFLSWGPIVNLTSPNQAMNTSFEPLELVNTYGAFGSVSKERYEVILEGTSDPTLTASTRWREYELPCKPGDPDRHPCWISPYHLRLDWQMWFLPFNPERKPPWFVHMVYKLLEGDRTLDTLLAKDPFPDKPPRWVRAGFYQYHFAKPGPGPAWWRRERVGEYLRPMSLDTPVLKRAMRAYGWSQ